MARILVVDDEPSALKVVAYILSDHHQVISMSAPEDALEKGESVQLVVTDVMMPNMNGFQFYIEFTKRWGKKPFIFNSSARQDKKILAGIASSDHTLFIQKPIDPKFLRQSVSQLLKKKKTPGS